MRTDCSYNVETRTETRKQKRKASLNRPLAAARKNSADLEQYAKYRARHTAARVDVFFVFPMLVTLR